VLLSCTVQVAREGTSESGDGAGGRFDLLRRVQRDAAMMVYERIDAARRAASVRRSPSPVASRAHSSVV